jgi:hypothetical protein
MATRRKHHIKCTLIPTIAETAARLAHRWDGNDSASKLNQVEAPEQITVAVMLFASVSDVLGSDSNRATA